MATSLPRLLSCFPKVTIVGRFNCTDIATTKRIEFVLKSSILHSKSAIPSVVISVQVVGGQELHVVTSVG